MSNPSIPMARPSFLAVCAAGLIALAIAMGIGRFAFTPMLPLMIRAGSADVAAGGWLAAANYAGYLLGALTTARIPLTPQRIGLVSRTVAHERLMGEALELAQRIAVNPPLALRFLKEGMRRAAGQEIGDFGSWVSGPLGRLPRSSWT